MSSSAMSKSLQRIAKLANDDGRYRLDAYLFVQQALAYAQYELGMGRPRPYGVEGEPVSADEEPPAEAHLTGQQLCDAIRLYAADLYGLMAKVVLNSWGIRATRDFGEIVYNLIEIGEMTKSESDRREDFDDVYDFDKAFQQQYQITMSDET
jgi:uncharacterized repeat protein (TIGR04138 family)